MKVLHLHSGNLSGGVETVLVTLAQRRHLVPSMESPVIDRSSPVDLEERARIRRELETATESV